MIERRGNKVWRRLVKSYYKLGKKGRVLHVVASMTACLTLAAPAFSAGFVITGFQSATQQVSADTDVGTVLPQGRLQVSNTSGNALGIELDADLAGISIDNQGGINVSAANDDATAISGGILTDSGITNSGTITVGAGGVATGLEFETFDNTNVLNTGTLDVSGDTARGILVEPGRLEGRSRIENGAGGVLQVRSQSGRAAGMELDELQDTARVVNAGVIDAASTDGGDVYGIRVENYVQDSSSVYNTGSITITTDNNSSGGFGIYLYYGMEDNARLENSGSITIVHNNDSTAYGMSSYYTKDNSAFVNSGLITMETHTGDNSGFMYGMYANDLDDSSRLVNSGTIMILQNNDGDSRAIGVESSEPGATILNSGTITMVNRGSGTTLGIDIDTSNGDAATIINQGTISLVNEGSGIARGIDASAAPIRNGGTVEVVDANGDLAEDLYSVNTQGAVVNTGVLRGQIQSGNLENYGVIRLPAATSVIDGNFINRSGSFLGLTLFSDDTPANTRVSTLSVNGTATIENGSCVNVDVTTADNHQGLLVGRTLTGVISSTGGITADVNGFYVTDNSVLLKFSPQLSSSNTALDLVVEQATSIEVATRAGNGVVGTGAAGVLDTLGNNAGSEICSLLGHLNAQTTTASIAGTVSQTAPVGATQIPSMVEQMVFSMGDVVQSRQGSVRGLNAGDAAPMMLDEMVWVKPFGSKIEQSDVDGINGFSAKSYGIAVGADTVYGLDRHIGVSFLYSRVDVDTHNLPQETDMNVVNMVVYGSRPVLDEATLFSYQAGGGFQFIDTSRKIQAVNARAESDYTAKNLFARAKVSRGYHLGEDLLLAVGPRLSYAYLYTPDYQETGANTLNLNVEGFDSHALIASLEGDLVWNAPCGMELAANLALGYDLINDTNSVNSSFQAGGAAFTTPGIDHSPLVYSAGVGLDKQFSSRFAMDIRYDFEGRGDDFHSHTVSSKMSWAF